MDEQGEQVAGEVDGENVKPGCWKNVKTVISRLRFPVTLEPLVALYTISVGLNEVIRSNLVIEKICQNKLNYTVEVCANLTNLEDTQKIVQENVADYEALYSTISFVPKILYALLAGTWSDQHGRKGLIFLPILGQFLACISYGLNFFFLKSLPWQFLFLELVNDLCGTYVAYYLAIYSYITDITPENGRTYRLAVIDGTDYVSTSIGTRISASLFVSLGGYYTVFGCSAASCVCACIYLLVFVKESLNKEEIRESVETPLQSVEQANYGSQSVEEVQGTTSANWFTSSFLFIFESLKTVFKPRKGTRRLVVLLAIFNFGCYIFTYNGTEGTHRYSFARLKYGWSEQEMSTYLFDYRIGYMLSLWILIPILTRVVRLGDTTIAIIACITSSVGFILPAVTDLSVTSTEDTVWYRNGSFVLNWFSIGSFICLLSPITTITTRSVISRAVPGDEIGRIYSVLALFSAASGSLVEAAFQALYSATISTFLGSYLCVLAGLLIITIPVNLVIRKILKTLD